MTFSVTPGLFSVFHHRYEIFFLDVTQQWHSHTTDLSKNEKNPEFRQNVTMMKLTKFTNIYFHVQDTLLRG
jgi:hypothetical protein